MWLDRLQLSLFLVAGSVAPAHPSPAQGIPFSQRGTTGQTLAFTEVAIEYGRPVARGRTLFGDSALVRWNRIWHPGADSATRISFSRDVLIEGRPLAAGTYSIWLIPREREPWTLILSRASHVFHTPYPGESHDVLRLDIMPERGAHMETLAIYFPIAFRDSGTLRVHWGDMMLPVRIVAPFRPEAPRGGGQVMRLRVSGTVLDSLP